MPIFVLGRKKFSSDIVVSLSAWRKRRRSKCHNFPFPSLFGHTEFFFLLGGGKGGGDLYGERQGGFLSAFSERNCSRCNKESSSPGKGRQKIVEGKGLRETHGGFPFSPRKKKRNKSGKSFWAGFYLLWRFAKVGIFDLAGSRYFCLLSNLIFAHFLKKLIFLLDL